jgi:hypothetical protein
MMMATFKGYAHDATIPMRKFLLRWVIALPYLMRSHLVDYKPGCDSLEHLLTEPEVCHAFPWHVLPWHVC